MGRSFSDEPAVLCLATVAIVLAACLNDPEPTPTAIATATETHRPADSDTCAGHPDAQGRSNCDPGRARADAGRVAVLD